MIVTGNLKDFSLSDIIKMSCVDIQTCQIIIKTNAGEGVIYFSNGMPVHAQLANTTGEEAVYRLLDETEKYGGVFRVEPDVVLPKRTITTTWDLILESRNNRTRETSPIRNTGIKTFDKDSYLGRREAITRVLENFRAQSAKRIPPVTPKSTPPVVQPEQPVRPVTTTLDEAAPQPAPVAEPKTVVRPASPKPSLSGRGASLSSVLNAFIERGRDIVEGVALVSTEGFIIASVLPEEFEDEHVAAISAVVVSLGERITRELRRGTMEQVYVRGKFGYVFLTQAGADALLTVITNPTAKLGMIFLDTKRTIQELESLL
jgi:hypothetical protein